MGQVLRSDANALANLDTPNTFLDYSIECARKRIEAIANEDSNHPEHIPNEILFDSLMNDLSASFRGGVNNYKQFRNSLFPLDHAPAIEYKQRSKHEAETYKTVVYTPCADGTYKEEQVAFTEKENAAKYWIDLEKAVAVFRTVQKCNVPISHLAKVNNENSAMQKSDSGFMSLTPQQQRRRARRAHEAVALASGIVGGKDVGNSKRCSFAAKKRRSKQLLDQANWLEKQVALDAVTGKYFRLSSSANKRKTRLAEMFTLMKGIEKLIKIEGLQWAGIVVTAPPNMHSNPKKGKNNWDGTLPHEVARWLSDGWSQIRSRLAHFDITLSGGWFRESHEDATPHVNFFVTFNHGDYREIARAFKEVFGHSKKAIKIMLGEHPEAVKNLAKQGKKQASFASYSMKYFMKAFNGWGADDTADAEETTASSFAYRRQGFIGLPQLSTWRELRRLRECPTESTRLAAAWRAAHRGDAAEWIALSGGLACKRSERPLQPLRELSASGKGMIVIGVTDTTKSINIKTKEVGRWKIINENMLPAAQNKDFNEIPDAAIEELTVRVNYPREPQEDENFAGLLPFLAENQSDFKEKLRRIVCRNAEKADEDRKFEIQTSIAAQNLAMMQANSARSRYSFKANS